jgi:ADP-ribosylglycohydrolase
MLRSLDGLSVGDAFGECFFRLSRRAIEEQRTPAAPWPWTDDTHMALSIAELLLLHEELDEDALIQRFTRRYLQEPWRGYAGGARRLLERCAGGADWRQEAPALFEGGSYGNGAAMRAAPIGAYFYTDPERARLEAERAARVTHAHIEGQAGAVAVAVAAALAASGSPPYGVEFLAQVIPFLPESKTRTGVERAAAIGPVSVEAAAETLGTGRQVAAFDTVPFCLWVVAQHGGGFREALWKTVAGLGDRDTTCAIVGGVLGAVHPVPTEWLANREPLPADFPH